MVCHEKHHGIALVLAHVIAMERPMAIPLCLGTVYSNSMVKPWQFHGTGKHWHGIAIAYVWCCHGVVWSRRGLP